MSQNERSYVDVTPSDFNPGERLFLPAVFKGLGTTLRHCFGNMGRDGKNKRNIHVVQYPEEKRDDRDVLDGGQYPIAPGTFLTSDLRCAC